MRLQLLRPSLALALVTAAGRADPLDHVNLFIGTASGANGGSGGNAFPGAAVPHGMAKVRPLPLSHPGASEPATQVGIDVDTAPRQAGYIADDSSITGTPSPAAVGSHKTGY